MRKGPVRAVAPELNERTGPARSIATADASLVAGIRAGDEAAFERMVETFYTPLCVFTYGYMRSADAAEDIVQDVLFWVWQRRAQWDVRDGRLATYLYSAVRNRAMNDARHRRRVDRWTPSAALDLRLAGRGPEPIAIDDALVCKERGQAVWQAVAALPARRREAVILRWYHDLPYAEIAQILDVSVKTVETTLRKALHSLRRTLDRRF